MRGWRLPRPTKSRLFQIVCQFITSFAYRKSTVQGPGDRTADADAFVRAITDAVPPCLSRPLCLSPHWAKHGLPWTFLLFATFEGDAQRPRERPTPETLLADDLPVASKSLPIEIFPYPGDELLAALLLESALQVLSVDPAQVRIFRDPHQGLQDRVVSRDEALPLATGDLRRLSPQFVGLPVLRIGLTTLTRLTDGRFGNMIGSTRGCPDTPAGNFFRNRRYR